MLRALLSTFAAGSLHHKKRVEEMKDCLKTEDKDITLKLGKVGGCSKVWPRAAA